MIVKQPRIVVGSGTALALLPVALFFKFNISGPPPLPDEFKHKKAANGVLFK